MSRPVGPCPGSAGKATLSPGKVWAFLTEADVHLELSDQTVTGKPSAPPTSQLKPCWATQLPGALAGPPVRWGWEAPCTWVGVCPAPLPGREGGAVPGHPQFPSRLPSLEMQRAAINLGPEFVPCPWAAEGRPHWSPALLWGPPALPACLPA